MFAHPENPGGDRFQLTKGTSGRSTSDARRANVLFQLVSHMDTRASPILTTNAAFDGRSSIFGDDVIATASQ